jgi:hypothetical protein
MDMAEKFCQNIKNFNRVYFKPFYLWLASITYGLVCKRVSRKKVYETIKSELEEELDITNII